MNQRRWPEFAACSVTLRRHRRLSPGPDHRVFLAAGCDTVRRSTESGRIFDECLSRNSRQLKAAGSAPQRASHQPLM